MSSTNYTNVASTAKNSTVEVHEVQELGKYTSTDEVRLTDPKTGGQKGSKPEQYALIPSHPLAELARVYGHGALKYDANNWRKGYAYTWSLSALWRHVEKFRQGESIDPDSGLHHLAHAAFHLFTLIDFERTNTGTDDRADT